MSEKKKTAVSKDDPTDWLSNWDNNSTPWHSSEVNKFLRLYFSSLLGGRNKIKCLVPLCGKTVDMMWMYRHGHSIVGVEFSEKGCIEFFTEQGLPYTKEEVPEINGSVLKSEDDRLKLYACDFFLFTSDIEGPFDAIWDRGSFVALSDKKRYADHLQTLMAPWCRLVIEVFQYDPSLRSGPPHPSTEEDVKAVFGLQCNVLQRVKSLEKEFGTKNFNFEEFYICIYVVTPKALKDYMVAHGGQEPNDTNQDYWTTRWQQGSTSYHKTEVHPMLKKHYDRLLNGRSSLKVFVPLCGKSLDMVWFYEQGHTVVGLEFVQKACEDFFSENAMSYTKEEVAAVDGSVYKNADGRIKIYCCDIYKFSCHMEGTFDAFWDKGSYCAILEKDRESYRKLMTSLAGTGFTALLEAPVFDPKLYAGPPRSIASEEVQTLYGDKTASLATVETYKKLKYGIEDLSSNYYMFVGK